MSGAMPRFSFYVPKAFEESRVTSATSHSMFLRHRPLQENNMEDKN